MRGEPPVIFGDGNQSRDFSYIDNVVEANLLAMKAKAGFGEAFNTACGKRTTVAQVASQLAALMGAAVQPVHREPRRGDVRHSLADITKAGALLGYRPSVDLSIGLERTVDWYRHHNGHVS